MSTSQFIYHQHQGKRWPFFNNQFQIH
ncbi:early nodulin-like protein 5 [Prunus dulcis]|uniref:Early nodulin-like protein 5 n=1 Tax=Prunus dulcis TaxID=3755 RepID=A0A4Y1RIE4_PRUDU|nr:early nodulin-like protein 5 [Prunus dulcis]